MKNALIIIIIITLTSCRSYQEKMRLEQGSSTLSEGGKIVRYGFQFTEKDSQHRVWYFSTDSILSFHPDYGLFSVGGNLAINENRVGLQEMQVNIDSLEEQRNETATRAEEEQSRIWYRTPWWIWGTGVLCVIAVVWRSSVQRPAT